MVMRTRSVVLWIVAVAGIVAGIALLARPPRPPRFAAGSGGAPPTPSEMVRQRLDEAVRALPSPVPTTDPLAPDYRPEKLLAAAGMDIIFEAEPRHEPWASTVEHTLGPPLEKHARKLFHYLSSLTLECRTTMCAIRWSFDRSLTERLQDNFHELLRQLFPGAGRLGNGVRYVHWAAPEWTGDVRDTGHFLAVATDHLNRAAEFLATPDGMRMLAGTVEQHRPMRDPAPR
jgi:hypothetical protein